MTRYHPLLVALHWLMALLIILALVAGTVMLEPLANDDPEKLNSLFGHMSIGITIGVLLIVRLITRWRSQKPPHAETGNALLNFGGQAAHWALYIFSLVMVVSGIGIALSAGLLDIVYGGSGAPLPEDFHIYTPRLMHGLVAKLLMLTILAHIAGWAYHQFILKDGLIRRMWFGNRNA